MSIISKFQYHQNWTPIEKQLIEYIVQHPEMMNDISAKELADQSQTSLSTVYRLCNKLEFKGFHEFKYHFLNENLYSREKDVDVNIPFQKNTTDHQIMTNIAQLYQQTINETMSLMNLDTLRKTAQILDQAKMINIFTSANNCQIADNFQYKMARIGKKVQVLTINYEQEMEAIHTNKETISIILSYSGKNKDLLKIAEILKNKHCPIILISSLLDKTFDKYCDFHILLCSKENHSGGKISSYSSHISAQYVMDILFSVIYKRHYEQYQDHQMQEIIFYKK